MMEAMATPFFFVTGYLDVFEGMRDYVLKAMDSIYVPSAKRNGFDFQHAEFADLRFSVGSNSVSANWGDRSLLSNPGVAWVLPYNPDPSVEQYLTTCASVLREAGWKLMTDHLLEPGFDKDKFRCFQKVANMGVECLPVTLIQNSNIEFSELLKIAKGAGLQPPLLLKPNDMLAGDSISAVSNEREFTYFKSQAKSLRGHPFLVQEFLEEHVDYRVYLYENQAIGCIRRVPEARAESANVLQGGRSETIEVPDKLVKRSVEISKEFTPGFFCVDWLEDKSGNVYFSELDTSGGFTSVKEPTLTRVSDAFFQTARRKFEGEWN